MAINTISQDGLDKSGVAAIQDYYMEHKEGFYERTFVKPMLGHFFNVNARDRVLIRSANATSGLQSYQGGHHHRGTVTFTGRELIMRLVKVDQSYETRRFSVEDYDSYMLRTGNDPRQFPYQAYVVSLILKAMYEDFTKNVIWGGREKGIIPGAPNQAQDTADGFFKLFEDEIIAGNLAPYITGIMTNTNAYDKVLDYVEAVLDSTTKETEEHVLYCSQALLRNFRKDYRDSQGQNLDSKNSYGLVTVPDYENVMFLPQDGIKGSGLVMAKPDNLHIGFDGPPALNMHYESRILKVEFDWKYGMQFASLDELDINEWAV